MPCFAPRAAFYLWLKPLQELNTRTYARAAFSEIPEVMVNLMPGNSQNAETLNSPLGAGEATQGPTTAAIANAVFHAVGVRVRQLPMTPDNLSKAALA